MDASRIFVVGSLHLDVVVEAQRLPALDETLVGSAVRYVCGGKGGNQAVAAARHGAKVSMAGRVADDAFGVRLLAHLESAGVESGQVQVALGGNSGMSAAIVDANGDYGAVVVSACNLDIDANEVDLPDDTAVVVLQNEVPGPVNLRAACAARDQGARTVLNAAPWRALDPALLDAVDLLVVNRVEANAMHGTIPGSAPRDQELAASLLASVSCAQVLVTLGAGGAWLACAATGVHHQPAEPVEVVSTHGAGDMFVGALAARLAVGETTRAAMTHASRAAALHVSSAPEEGGSPRFRMFPEGGVCRHFEQQS